MGEISSLEEKVVFAADEKENRFFKKKNDFVTSYMVWILKKYFFINSIQYYK